jgi:hypothetical protein
VSANVARAHSKTIAVAAGESLMRRLNGNACTAKIRGDVLRWRPVPSPIG